jgi:MoxR-like ATPase
VVEVVLVVGIEAPMSDVDPHSAQTPAGPAVAGFETGPAATLAPGPADAPPGYPGRNPAGEVEALLGAVTQVVLGDPAPIGLAVAAFLAEGHVLFEDIPGVGKTLLAKALAATLGGSFGRAQGTADLLPSDLTGISVFEEDTKQWHFRPGPLCHNVVLVDELNRATPRAQSALLEAMAERQVTVDGTTHALPDPFFVIATQNPQGDLGTFPLVAGQRDRFAVSLSLGLPGRAAERLLVAGQGGEPLLTGLTPIASLASWQALRQRTTAAFVHDAVTDYALELLDTFRSRLGTQAPLSTRAAVTLLRVARGHAVVAGRDHVAPDDVQAVAVAVLAHRLVDATNGDLPTARTWVRDVVAHLPVPPAPGC